MVDVKAFGMSYNDPRYIPDETEIRIRAASLRMMTKMGWNPTFIDSVMLEDTPGLSVVLNLIDKYGHREAYRRMLIFSGIFD